MRSPRSLASAINHCESPEVAELKNTASPDFRSTYSLSSKDAETGLMTIIETCRGSAVAGDDDQFGSPRDDALLVILLGMRQGEHYTVTNGDRRDTLADRQHDTAPFVADGGQAVPR